MTRKLGKEGDDMKKEEILERSRKENQNGDEREKMQIQISENRGFTVTAFMAAFLMLIGSGDVFLFGKSIPFNILMSFIFISGVTVDFYSKYKFFRKKKYLVRFLFSLLLVLVVFIKFVFESQ